MIQQLSRPTQPKSISHRKQADHKIVDDSLITFKIHGPVRYGKWSGLTNYPPRSELAFLFVHLVLLWQYSTIQKAQWYFHLNATEAPSDGTPVQVLSWVHTYSKYTVGGFLKERAVTKVNYQGERKKNAEIRAETKFRSLVCIVIR